MTIFIYIIGKMVSSYAFYAVICFIIGFIIFRKYRTIPNKNNSPIIEAKKSQSPFRIILIIIEDDRRSEHE